VYLKRIRKQKDFQVCLKILEKGFFLFFMITTLAKAVKASGHREE